MESRWYESIQIVTGLLRKMKLIQADLVQDNKSMTAWIDQTKNLREGSKVTLKGVSGWWLVKKLYLSGQPFDQRG